MRTVRTADAHWEGSLFEGQGEVERLVRPRPLRGHLGGPRRATGGNTSPEELIAAAHSACFNMALSNGLAQGGNPPPRSTLEPTSPSRLVRGSPASS